VFHTNHSPNPTPADPIATLSRAQTHLFRYVACLSARPRASLSTRPRPLHSQDVAHSYALPLVHLRGFLQTRRDLATSPPDLIATIDRFLLDGSFERLFATPGDPPLSLSSSHSSSLGDTSR
jgi:hypothetical protein